MSDCSRLRVLELFAGIGGMKYALEESGVDHEVLEAWDINTTSNLAYKHNFPKTLLKGNNIESLKLDATEPDFILMSPPCQPFTRVGLKKGLSDARCKALAHIIYLLGTTTRRPSYILLENVRGFEESDACNALLDALRDSGYHYQQFLLCPTQFGIPNSRLRYYLIAKLLPKPFCFTLSSEIMTDMPTKMKPNIWPLSNYIDNFIDIDEYLVPDKVLERYAKVLDIVVPSSKMSCCFTKSYGHYAEGTGSILSCHNEFQSLWQEYLTTGNCQVLSELKLRYFSPGEIQKLMGFPDTFEFPSELTVRQKYRLLGNSLNVHVVSQLISLLVR